MILITGSDGFISSNLLKRYDNAIGIDIHNRNNVFESSFPWQKISKVYHLGALSSTTETNVDRIHDLNVRYSINLFEEAIKHKVPVVYASSASVYGNSLTYQINPLNYYALSKATVDYWVQDNMSRFTNVVGCRFFNVYGDGEEHKGNQASPIYQFTLQAQQTGTIKIFEGSKDYFRDFIHVDDALDCMEMRKESGIYDIGTNNPVSFQYVASLVARKYNAFIEEIPFPDHLKDKYQWYTCARKHYDHKFTSVREFLEFS